MKALMISNPNSTTQNAELFRNAIPRIRAVPGLRLLSTMTQHAGHAEEMCRGLTRDDYDVVLVFGGDGTVNEAVNGLLGPADGTPRDPQAVPALAVVPTGSANVFARALGFSDAPLEAVGQLADALAAGSRRTVRMGTWNERWFAVNAGFGLDADVIARMEKVRSKGLAASPLRYSRVALQAWVRTVENPPAIDAELTFEDGSTRTYEHLPLCLASNTNPWTFFGPLPVVTNPRNSFDKGLGVFGLRNLRGVKGAAALLSLAGTGDDHPLRRWTEDRVVRADDVAQVTLTCMLGDPQRFQVDGEYVGQLERMELRSVEDPIEVIAPV